MPSRDRESSGKWNDFCYALILSWYVTTVWRRKKRDPPFFHGESRSCFLFPSAKRIAGLAPLFSTNQANVTFRSILSAANLFHAANKHIGDILLVFDCRLFIYLFIVAVCCCRGEMNSGPLTSPSFPFFFFRLAPHRQKGNKNINSIIKGERWLLPTAAAVWRYCRPFFSPPVATRNNRSPTIFRSLPVIVQHVWRRALGNPRPTSFPRIFNRIADAERVGTNGLFAFSVLIFVLLYFWRWVISCGRRGCG